MLAMTLSSVLLPEPLRPTTPKNSPLRTSKLTSRSAWRSRYSIRARGCTARSLNELIRCLGIRNRLWIPCASMTTGSPMPLSQSTRVEQGEDSARDLVVQRGLPVPAPADGGAGSPCLVLVDPADRLLEPF